MPNTYTVSSVTTSGSAATNVIWVAWNDALTTTGCSSNVVSYSTDTAWTIWVNQATTTGSVTYSSANSTDLTWKIWVDDAQIRSVSSITPEELARRQNEQIRINREVAERAAKRSARIASADERARRLLQSHLSPEQAAQYEKDKYFEVIAKGGKRRYRIHYGLAGNITVFEGERAVEKLCIHTAGVPFEDNLLAQKLMLEANEALFRKTANITRLAA